MSPLTIELPDTVSATDARFYLAIKLLEIGRLSSGQAAELAGLTKPTFMELLGKSGVPVFDYSATDLDDDINHARRVNRKQ